MRLRTHPRAERLFRRLPRITALSALELLLLALIAVQAARLVWTLVTPVDPVGQPFNPEHHQAMSMVDVEGHAPGHVVQVYQKGWLLNERLLRPALVTISKHD